MENWIISSKNRVEFVLFKDYLTNITSELLNAILEHSYCIRCDKKIEFVSVKCSCWKKEDFVPYFFFEYGAIKRLNHHKTSGCLGAYYISDNIHNEIIWPLYKKNRRKKEYSPRASERRRKRLIEAGGKPKKEDIIWLRIAQNNKCYYCDVSLDDKFHVDHLHPISWEGDSSMDNLALTCKTCNQSKHSKFEEDFWKVIKKTLEKELYQQKKKDSKLLAKLKKERIKNENPNPRNA